MRIPGSVAKLAAVAALLLPTLAAAQDGDPAKGEKVFAKCKACHSLEAGENKVGPYLTGIIGRAAATAEGFSYSDAMAASGLTWTEENLAAYLANPKEFVPDNKMAFPGLKKPEDIANLLAFLRAQQGL